MTDAGVLVQRHVERAQSPVHIHVSDEMPVHVHVKKQKKRAPTLNSGNNPIRRSRSSERYGEGNLRDRGPSPGSQGPTRGARRSRPPPRPGYGPALRANTAAGQKYSRQGGKSGRLSTGPGLTNRSLSRDRDLDDDGQVDEQGRQSAALLSTLQDQEQALRGLEQELELKDSVNRRLRQSVDGLNRSDVECSDNERLQRKLLEVELEAQSVEKQACALTDTIQLMREDQRISPADSAMLQRHKALLDDRLSQFGAHSAALRTLLTHQRDQQDMTSRLAEQRDRLLERLARTQDLHQGVRGELLDKEQQIVDLKIQLDAQREENMAVAGLQTSLSATRAHLQKQLKVKDGDCNRMAVQIRTLESQLAQERIDVDHLRGLLMQAKKKPDQDKEALKRATRVQKERAARSEDALDQMRACVMERDSVVEAQNAELQGLRAQLGKLGEERGQALSDLGSLQRRVGELEGVLERGEVRGREKEGEVEARLQGRAQELSSLKLDNDRMRMQSAAVESRLAQRDAEMAELRANLREYQQLVDEYRSQMRNGRGMNEPMTDGQRRDLQRARQDMGEGLERSEFGEEGGQTAKLDTLERKLNGVEDERRELSSRTARLEEALKQTNVRLEERTAENAGLQRQLSEATGELRRVRDQNKDKLSSSERATQTKLLELEAQLGQSRAEVTRLKRERDEAERKFNSRLYDLKDRLEQSHATNRSLQNYVQFLKQSYTTAFNDSTLGPTTSTPHRTPLY